MKKLSKVLSIILILVMMLLVMTSCGSEDEENAVKITFKNSSLEEVQRLDGKIVTITGYMSALDTLDGSLCYLMNLPLQSCPYCQQNSNELYNTMAVLFKKATKSSDYTSEAITVTGKLVLGDFTDSYGYSYSYRIENASFKLAEVEKGSSYTAYATLVNDGDDYTLYNMINALDQYIWCEEDWDGSKTYEEVKAMGTIDLETYGYTKLYSKIEAYKNEHFNEFLSLMQDAKSLAEKVNVALPTNDVNNMHALQSASDDLYYGFLDYMSALAEY